MCALRTSAETGLVSCLSPPRLVHGALLAKLTITSQEDRTLEFRRGIEKGIKPLYEYLAESAVLSLKFSQLFAQSRHGSCHKEVHTQGPVTGPMLESCSQMLKLTRDARGIYLSEEKSDSLCEQVSSSSTNLKL